MTDSIVGAGTGEGLSDQAQTLNRTTATIIQRSSWRIPLPTFLSVNTSFARGRRAREDGAGTEGRGGTTISRLRQLQRSSEEANQGNEGREQNSSTQSTTSRSSISTQPVIVHTYSRNRSRRSRKANTTAPDGPAVGEVATNAATNFVDSSNARLPPIEDFKFDLILRAVEPDINSTVDAIAEICARSRLSLADEYGAHLPPFTHTFPPMPRTRPSGQGNGRSLVHGSSLTTVPETSSSSEHSTPSTSSGRTKMSAYASLVKVKQRSGRSASESGKEAGWNESTITSEEIIEGGGVRQIGTQNSWPGKGFTQPLIIRVATPKVSKEVAAVASDPSLFAESKPNVSSQEGLRLEGAPSGQRTRALHARSKSWFPWVTGRSNAQERLKDLLRAANERDQDMAPG